MSKLAELKKGDRFRVTIEGVVTADPDIEGDMYVQWDGGAESYIWRRASEAPTFHIEKIDPPLAVGDMVTDNDDGYTDTTYEVRALVDDLIVIKSFAGVLMLVSPKNYVRAPA